MAHIDYSQEVCDVYMSLVTHLSKHHPPLFLLPTYTHTPHTHAYTSSHLLPRPVSGGCNSLDGCWLRHPFFFLPRSIIAGQGGRCLFLAMAHVASYLMEPGGGGLETLLPL